jgi:hypothetical protein
MFVRRERRGEDYCLWPLREDLQRTIRGLLEIGGGEGRKVLVVALLPIVAR